MSRSTHQIHSHRNCFAYKFQQEQGKLTCSKHGEMTTRSFHFMCTILRQNQICSTNSQKKLLISHGQKRNLRRLSPLAAMSWSVQNMLNFSHQQLFLFQLKSLKKIFSLSFRELKNIWRNIKLQQTVNPSRMR